MVNVLASPEYQEGAGKPIDYRPLPVVITAREQLGPHSSSTVCLNVLI